MTTDGLFDDDDVWRPILERGFGAVDMEAAGVAEVCEAAGVDWSVYRGISDRPDEHIVDQAVFSLSKPDGSADPVAVAKYLARDPRRAKALAHLNKCMQLAATHGGGRRLRRSVGAAQPASSAARRPFGSSRRAITCRSMSFSDAMRRICWIDRAPRHRLPAGQARRPDDDLGDLLVDRGGEDRLGHVVALHRLPRTADRRHQLLELGRAGLRGVGVARDHVDGDERSLDAAPRCGPPV